MTKENIKTNTILRYSQYQKRLLHTFSFEKLKKQIEMLHDQEFIINVPIGGVVDLLDVLLFSDMEERAALIASYGKEVRNLERRMADLAARTAAGRRTDHTRSPATPER